MADAAQEDGIAADWYNSIAAAAAADAQEDCIVAVGQADGSIAAGTHNKHSGVNQQMNSMVAAATAMHNLLHDSNGVCFDNVDIPTRHIRQRKKETRVV
jgi:hypothetical protein